MNGAAKVKPPVPTTIEEICAALPHFGDAWEQRFFSNPVNPGSQIIMLVPPERLVGTRPRFFSKVHLMSNRGPLEINFEIPGAVTISQAEHSWREAAQAAIKEAHEKLREQERRILIPDATTAGTALRSKLN